MPSIDHPSKDPVLVIVTPLSLPLLSLSLVPLSLLSCCATNAIIVIPAYPKASTTTSSYPTGTLLIFPVRLAAAEACKLKALQSQSQSQSIGNTVTRYLGMGIWVFGYYDIMLVCCKVDITCIIISMLVHLIGDLEGITMAEQTYRHIGIER